MNTKIDNMKKKVTVKTYQEFKKGKNYHVTVLLRLLVLTPGR